MRDEAPLHHPALDDERIQRAAVEIFGLVEQICEEATSAGRLRLDTAADSSASRDPCLKPSGGGARRKLSWAMGGRWRRTEKLELFKELVQTLYNLVPPDDYDAGRPVASAWSTEFGRIMSRLEAWARQDVHAWLRHIPGERYHDSLQRRLDGTCVWMLSESLFQQWITWELSPGPSIPMASWTCRLWQDDHVRQHDPTPHCYARHSHGTLLLLVRRIQQPRRPISCHAILGLSSYLDPRWGVPAGPVLAEEREVFG
ncbi:hypothetical protein VD0002_g6074 [Verticillium dahliae]|uniref:Uncharacterized protein n=1 Tax=Verticillium dahliae TaxID=27337 RepID=A0A2J8EJY3_VERDA|nr:hypothetical protein BJF96_g3794 [Verticillium dahliae]PNH38281.1 hypothetical protein VD0004_g8529 [Verticillium dahliae]PNH49941.1 hypothetical protein VD0003_g7219 [Verticillium dahliae]PNH61802.1 hypothetical protein VD0002_g6074 [Verticillium dahliae]PNH65529.1 hypothetical protein VD0001_g8460 [Verticillium dahliae]